MNPIRRPSYEAFARTHLKIQTKDSRIVPFSFNPPQRRLDAIVRRLEREKKPIRVIILKARQEGISTYIGGRLFYRSTLWKHVNAGIIAHDKEGSGNLFQMSKRFYDHFPEPRPVQKRSNKIELVFDDERGKGLDSRIILETAEDENAGRSATYQVVHGSEVAFWGQHVAGRDEAVFKALMQSVPLHAGTEVYLESTANGASGMFHDLFWPAWRGESSTWVAVFIPWFENPEYAVDVPEPVAFDASLTERERKLRDDHGLTLEQIHWRRIVIEDQFLGDELKFQQENPATPEEAFLASDATVFDGERIRLMRDAAREPDMRAEISANRIEPKPSGRLSLWLPGDQMVDPFARYVISADVSEGIGGDYSSADALDVDTRVQVAHWHGYIDPDAYGVLLAYLARIFNGAMLAIEANNHGYTTIKSALAMGARIYRRRRLDKLTNKWTDAPGWQTNPQTKPMLVDALAAAIRDGTWTINCRPTVEELASFVRDEKGRYGARGRSHDDRVISLGIGVTLVDQGLLILGPKRERERELSPEEADAERWRRLLADVFDDSQSERLVAPWSA